MFQESVQGRLQVGVDQRARKVCSPQGDCRFPQSLQTSGELFSRCPPSTPTPTPTVALSPLGRQRLIDSGQADLLPQLWDQIQRESQGPPFLAVAGRPPPPAPPPPLPLRVRRRALGALCWYCVFTRGHSSRIRQGG